MGLLNRTSRSLEDLTTKLTNSSFFLKLIVACSFIHTYLKGAYDKCYTYVPFFAIFCNISEDVVFDLCRIFTNQKYEPNNRFSWFNTVKCYREILSKSVPMTFITEDYVNMGSYITDDSDIPIILEDTNDRIDSPGTIGNIINTFAMIKYKGNYIVRLLPTHNVQYEDKRSRVRFISIEYCHPKMEKSIPLVVNSCYMRDGNELFSVGFVQRLLQYQSLPYIFDESYTLKLMDDCMSTIELNATQYIHLSIRKFAVKELPEEESKELPKEESKEELIEEVIAIDETGIPLIPQKIEEETEL